MTRAVQRLLDREEILACLRRYAKGIDRNDLELIESAFHEDALICFGDDVKTRQQLLDYSRRTAATRDASEHYISNQEVDVDGDSAHVETYYLAVMKLFEGSEASIPGVDNAAAPANEMTIYGGRYVDRFERRDGEWRVAMRWSVPEWGLRGPLFYGDWIEAGRLGTRDRSDVSYDRPLRGPSS
jgi:hypothetical protein